MAFGTLQRSSDQKRGLPPERMYHFWVTGLGTHFPWGGILSFLPLWPSGFSSIFPQEEWGYGKGSGQREGRLGWARPECWTAEVFPSHGGATVLCPTIGNSWKQVFPAPIGTILMHSSFLVVGNASNICLSPSKLMAPPGFSYLLFFRSLP